MEHGNRLAPRIRRPAQLVLALAVALTVVGPAQAAFAGDRQAAKELFALTNDSRADKGVALLTMDAELSRYAVRHSREMAARSELFHTTDLAKPLQGRSWSIAGENVGAGYSIGDLHTAFMNSAGHRRNVLRPSFKYAGVGVFTQEDGQIWVTVVFYG